jgi:CheY-like chemotaxis protein
MNDKAVQHIPGPAPTILCVEDEVDLRTDITEELEAAGYTVVQAANGRAAMTLVESIRPDLVLCDITMPVMGGYEFMERFRTEKTEMADVPFIFLTALADRSEMLQGKLAGADDYLVKPVDYDDLLLTIRARLRFSERIRLKAIEEIEAQHQSLIDKAVREGDITLTALAAALDRLSVGIFVLDETGSVKLVNDAGRRLAAPGGPLIISGNGLRASMPRTSAALRTAFERTLGEIGAVETVAAQAIEGHTLLVQVSSAQIPGANVRHNIVMVVDPATRSEASPELLSAMFGCTPTEARLAAALVAGKKLEEIRKEFGVAQTTVVFHLQNLFQKTQTNRQADLVALLIRATFPLMVKD